MPRPRKILIIDDDSDVQTILRTMLERDGYQVAAALDAMQGPMMTRKESPDLIILDIMLPVLDGYEVCKRLRAGGDSTPIIMLTVKDKELDKILGLELGADDYVTKPFSLRELTARAKAVLRRSEEREKDLNRYGFGEVRLDFKTYEATRKGRRIDLTPLEFHMLKLLIQKKGQALTRDDFLDRIWGEDNVSVSFRTVDSHIANIRRKIEDDPSRPKHILSIRSVGYKFVD